MPSKPGNFTAYLEYMKRSKDDTPAAHASPITLLQILALEPQREMPMADLGKRSGMDPTECRDALRGLVARNYVTVSGPTLEEVVKLTATGADTASLARQT